MNYHFQSPFENNFRYQGAWINGDERNTFDGSVYYHMMIDSSLTLRSRSLSDGTGDDARPLYSARDSDDVQNGNFIVSDFAIVYDFTVDDETRFATCEVKASDPTCDKASTYGTVEAFAAVIIIKIQGGYWSIQIKN